MQKKLVDDSRSGSGAEELTLSKTFPLYPNNRKSILISNTSGATTGRKQVHKIPRALIV